MLKFSNWWLILLLSHLKSIEIRTEGKILSEDWNNPSCSSASCFSVCFIGFAEMDYNHTSGLVSICKNWLLNIEQQCAVNWSSLARWLKEGCSVITLVFFPLNFSDGCCLGWSFIHCIQRLNTQRACLVFRNVSERNLPRKAKVKETFTCFVH